MSTDNNLPATINWDQTDDVIGLLDWLDSQPQADPDAQPAHSLPGDAYQVDPQDAALRAIAGLLAGHQQRQQQDEASALIRRLLDRDDLDGDKLQMLMAELEKHEDRLRQASLERVQAIRASAPPSGLHAPPETVPPQPFFETFTTEDDDLAVLFAVEVRGVQPTRQPPAVEAACADLLLALYHADDYIQDRYGLGLDLRFSWRFISDQRALSLALLVRVGGLDDREQIERAAVDVWRTIDSLLPLNRVIYAFRPVTSPERLNWLRQPTEVASGFAVMRQQHQFEFEGRSIYMVQPVGRGEGNRQALLAEMLRAPGVNVLDISIRPARWTYDEREQVRQMLHPVASEDNTISGTELDVMLKRMSDERYRRALEIYNRSLGRDLMFEVRIVVASDQVQSASSLPIVAALNLFGSSHYEVRPAALAGDRHAAARHLRDLNGLDWPRPQSPPGLERLPHLWTPEEALAAAQLPIPGPAGLPGIPIMKTRITMLPAELPADGLLLGDAYDPTLNQVTPVNVNITDRARHIYVVGRTGTGKTTLLENMAVQDIHAGRGVGIVDPHGDLIESILARIPPERMQDVVLFDPSEAERPVGLNILDVEGSYEKNMVISEFMGLMYSIYDPGRTGIVGPRFEQAVRNAMHTALSIKGSTLVDVMRILSDRDYKRACIKLVKDPLVKSYWRDIADAQSDFHRSEVLDYITSKFGRFTGDTTIRSIIGQPRTTMDFNRIMNEGKILLVNLSKGKIGVENSRFLGLLLVPRLLISAFSRARQPADQRRPFYLYIDEFHNFTTPMFSSMLSEGRKYGLSLTLANQFISQLTDDVREAVLGNVGTLGVFQVGVKDAYLLQQELYPVFNLDDLVNFPAFHMAVKMPLEKSTSQPFMLKTRPSSLNPNAELAEVVRQHALLQYGRDTVLIDAEIRRRFQQPPEAR